MPSPTMLPAPSSGANQVTSRRRDPVAAQINAVAASVSASNPHLPEAECRRLARRVVAQYLRTADLADSAVSDDPGSGGGGGSGGGSGGTGPMGHMLEWRGLQSMMPGGGGGGGAAAAEEAAPELLAAAL